MEALEQQAIATAPMDCRPKIWLQYIDDIHEVVQKDCVQKLTDHINQVDKSGSIQFTYETESDGKTRFLDTFIVKKEDGSVKLLIYRKLTHTDQYLNYKSTHPLYKKMGVIRTFNLLDRKDRIVTKDDEDYRRRKKKVVWALKNWLFSVDVQES